MPKQTSVSFAKNAAVDCPMPFDQAQTSGFRWRRVALYQPLLVSESTAVNADGTQRQRLLRSCQPGMQAAFRRNPDGGDIVGVYVRLERESQIGILPKGVVDRLAPKLDLARTVFDAEIWSLDKIRGEQDHEEYACWILIKEFELAPLARFSPMWRIWRDIRSSAEGVAGKRLAPSAAEARRRQIGAK
jgi:hypothetical protein